MASAMIQRVRAQPDCSIRKATCRCLLLQTRRDSASGRVRHSVRANILVASGGQGTSRPTNLTLKFKNDFAAAFPLRGMRDRGFDFAKRISFFDFCFEQTAPGHLEKR